jgi:hypothetical protein
MVLFYHKGGINMPSKHIDDLTKIDSLIDDNHYIMVYQDNRLKKIDSKDIFYSKNDIEKILIEPKNNIIESLINLGVNVAQNATLFDLINYVNDIDIFEIGVRRLVHDGTNTSNFTGNPSQINNPKYVNMGNPQSSPSLERCYRIGNILTVIPRNDSPDPSKDLLYAAMSTSDTMVRNDFYGGDYASEQWSSGIYPWNSMEKVIDDNGNHFTKVPLYFIKEEYLTDTGIDISSSYPIIPDKYMNNLVYKYTFVCKVNLPGYRPAEFFYDYKKYNMVEDKVGDYIYLEDLQCYTIPSFYKDNDKRYSLGNNIIDDYSKILTREHYFACYETSTEYDSNGEYVVSKPGNIPETGFVLDRLRDLCNIADESYFIRDIRSYTDFYYTLFSIEFATTDCQSISMGYVNDPTNGTIQTIIDDVSNSNTFKVTYNFKIGSYIALIGRSGFTYDTHRKVLSSVANGDGTYTITIDGDPITIEKNSYIYSATYRTGSCDEIPFRSAYKSNNASDPVPFKWNWIENIYGNTWKYLDGITIHHEPDNSGLIENRIYVSNNPKLYNDNLENYNTVKYIMPSEFLDDNGSRTSSNVYVTQLGYDPIYPWCQVPSKCSSLSSNTGYCDLLQQNSEVDSDNKIRVVITSGNMTSNYYSGLYMYNIRISNTTSQVGMCSFFQKIGK